MTQTNLTPTKKEYKAWLTKNNYIKKLTFTEKSMIMMVLSLSIGLALLIATLITSNTVSVKEPLLPILFYTGFGFISIGILITFISAIYSVIVDIKATMIKNKKKKIDTIINYVRSLHEKENIITVTCSPIKNKTNYFHIYLLFENKNRITYRIDVPKRKRKAPVITPIKEGV